MTLRPLSEEVFYLSLVAAAGVVVATVLSDLLLAGLFEAPAVKGFLTQVVAPLFL